LAATIERCFVTASILTPAEAAVSEKENDVESIVFFLELFRLQLSVLCQRTVLAVALCLKENNLRGKLSLVVFML
jgi:hypothetical protein